MPLQFDGAGGSFGFRPSATRFSRYIKVFVNKNPIQPYGYSCILNLFTVMRLCIGEFDVIGLPGKRGKAGVDGGVFDRINATALVMDAIGAKGVQDLVLIHIHMVQTAVPTTLPSGKRPEGKHELQVQEVVVEFSFAAYVFSIRVEEPCFRIKPASIPFLLIAAVKKYDCFLGWFESKSRALTNHFLKLQFF